MQEVRKLKDYKSEDYRQIFASYHFTNKNNPLQNGFGNVVVMRKVDEIEIYQKDMFRFIKDLEDEIIIALKQQLAMDCQVKLIFFK